MPLVRIAEIEIEPEQLEAYNAVALKDNPAHIRIFETYADRSAYESHLKTRHFLKYKASTERMIRSLKLVETEPIYLGVKPR